MAQRTADFIVIGGGCPIDPYLFRFERFAEGDLVKGRYSYSIPA